MVDREYARRLATETLASSTASAHKKQVAREVLAMLGSPTNEERALAKMSRSSDNGLARQLATLKGERVP